MGTVRLSSRMAHSQAVDSYEERARTHELARGNGHAGKKIDLEG